MPTAPTAPTASPAPTADPAPLRDRYHRVRGWTDALAAPLSAEDAQVQSMPDASPAKWHLAHTTWFFETLLLAPHEPGFRPFDADFRVLFNSYYQGVGAQHPRPQRGLLTRPSLARVNAYRADVDARMAALLGGTPPPAALGLVELGLQHEQQHQELLLTDILHLLSCNPVRPVYRGDSGDSGSTRDRAADAADPGAAGPPGWVGFGGGVVAIGHAGDGFAFDNETPRHRRLLEPFELADRLVTNAEWLAFVDDGGYRDPRWWLAAGWDWVRAQAVEAPLYWRREAGGWQLFDLHGAAPPVAQQPVRHLSFYEADAFARWHGAQYPGAPPSRLPTEAEWEHAAASVPGPQACDEPAPQGPPRPPAPLRPRVAGPGPGLRQMLGTLWQWTRNAYEPYPGYVPWTGAVGEYNGKFMVDQLVLRGGSFATPPGHVRASYRNFFPAPTRWQFSGLRLARDGR